MFVLKSGEEILASIRQIHPCLKKLKISSVEIDKLTRGVKYNFICDEVVSEELKNRILEEMIKETSPHFLSVSLTVKKIASDAELVNREIIDFVQKNFPSISIFLKNTDVFSVTVGDVVKYSLKLTADGIEYVNRNGVIRKLNEYLSHKFCSDFSGETIEKEAEETISLLSTGVYESQLQKIQLRTIKVKDVLVIDDIHMGNTAVYIEDALYGQVTVCGKITKIYEKQTKTGKPFFVIHFTDTTANLSGVYFTRKSTYDKIKYLAEGDAIIMSGTLAERDGKPSFTISKINRCTFPEDFVKQEKFKKQPPREYSVIFPEKANTIKVASVFDDLSPLPQELVEKEYVVFDLETTGLELMSNGITEIGAVRISGGKITEHFTTLVKPDYHINAENQALTGISNEMVKNAPKISTVLPDFMKFIEGSVLVGQNVEFDLKFLRRFATAEEYEVTNPVMDTMELSRKYVPGLKKNNLATLAEYFGIVFQHHRALSDAYATAEIFIELMKLKKKAESQSF